MTAITRTPEGAQFPLTVATVAELQIATDDGKWAVVCEGHQAIVVTDTKAQALKVLPYDFCEECANHHYGIAQAS